MAPPAGASGSSSRSESRSSSSGGGGVPAAASKSQRPDDLVCHVQHRRLGARFAWGHGLRYWCLAVPESRDRVRTSCGFPVPVAARFAACVGRAVACGWDILTLAPHRTLLRAGAEHCFPGAAGCLAYAQGVTRASGALAGTQCSPPISPGCPPPGRAVGVCCPPVFGASVRVWGSGTVPLACVPCGGCTPRGRQWKVGPGGVPSHRCGGRLVSGAFPLPATRASGRAAGPRPPCFPSAGGFSSGDQAPAP